MSNVREPEVVRTENAVDPTQRIFINAKDKDVATVVIYTADGVTFTYDQEGSKEVKPADIFDLFINGVVAVKDDVYYKPTSCTKAGNIEFNFAA